MKSFSGQLEIWGRAGLSACKLLISQTVLSLAYHTAILHNLINRNNSSLSLWPHFSTSKRIRIVVRKIFQYFCLEVLKQSLGI